MILLSTISGIWHFFCWIFSLIVRLWLLASKLHFRQRMDNSRTNPQSQNAPFLCHSPEVAAEGDIESLIDSYFEQSDGVESLDRRRYCQNSNKNNQNVGFMNNSTSGGYIHFCSEEEGIAIVDGPTAPQRLANFLSRPFRNNPLKRTKSVSKLDRKTLNNINYNLHSNLQYSQENISPLGYIYDRTTHNRRLGEAGVNNLRSCRSHESLFSCSTTNPTVDLVDPIYPSVMNVPRCFRIANKYCACKTSNERSRWVESLRKTTNSNRNRMRRRENSLEIWILEAKGIPLKRKYYCEICLNKTLYARTSAKPRSEICFWGEHFEFSPLPVLDIICVNLYREADPKKKKDRSALIGYIQIKIDEVCTRHPIERWYAITGGSDGNKSTNHSKDKGEQAAIRVKARYQSVDILPLHMYDELLRFFRYRYLSLCKALEPLLGVKAKEDFATSLVRVMHNQKLVKDFLCDLIISEIEMLDNEHLMFRGNSLATKAMEAYMKLIAEDYLKDTLGEFVKSILESNDNCEVDPLKMPNVNPSILEKNRLQLICNVEIAWNKIINSTSNFPIELREIFDCLRQRLDRTNRRDLADMLISSSIFLRFLCPAILSPSLFNLVSEYPSGKAARNLTLIAKTLQTLANFTKFGGKEHYMEFMNDFVGREWNNMHYYLMRISTISPYTEKSANTVSFDLGREISLLHSYLCEIWTDQIHERITVKDKQVEDLKMILNRISVLLNNGVDVDCSSYSSQSPPALREYDLLSWSKNPTQFPRMCGRSIQTGLTNVPASHLGTTDDYVLDTALINDSLAVRKAGICVQQHRNGQLKNARQIMSKSLQPTQKFENDSIKISRISAKSYNSLVDGSVQDDSDSDDATSKIRQVRPARKCKRRLVNSTDQNDKLVPLNSNTSSSGYQSQEQSNSMTSSNSSSPIERTSSIAEKAERSPLHITNPMYLTSSNSSTLSSPSVVEKTMKERHLDDEPFPSSSNLSFYGYIRHSATNSGEDGGSKYSLPRTNPRIAARNSHSSTLNAETVKPTLIDINNDNDLPIITATPAKSIVPSCNIEEKRKVDVKSDDIKQEQRFIEDWQNSRLQENQLHLDQKEIIEQQKREILRLLRENEELRKHVTAQKYERLISSISSRVPESQQFADSGASEDSYDSFSSFNDLPPSLAVKTTSH